MDWTGMVLVGQLPVIPRCVHSAATSQKSIRCTRSSPDMIEQMLDEKHFH